MSCYTGKYCRMDLTSADVSTAVALVLYDANGAVITLDADERVIVRSINIKTAVTIKVTVFADNDNDNVADDGERLLVVTGAGTTGTFLSAQFGPEGAMGALGIPIHVIASAAGQVDLTITGSITKG